MASSSYKVKPADIFGRLGQGIGQGINEHLPKEIERRRMQSHLENLGNQQGLSQFQQIAGLLSTPGITPQGIQTGGEVLKQRGMRDALRGTRTQQEQQQVLAEDPRVTSAMQQIAMSQGQNQQPSISKASETPQGNFPAGQPQIVEKNPLSPEMQPGIPWTPEQRNAETSKVWDQQPYLTFSEAQSIAADNERRYLESPEAYQKQQERLEKVQNEVNSEIDSQLRKKLHIPKNEEIFSKLPGETQNRIERGVSQDLRKNPQGNVKDIVNTWTDRALQNEKQKTQLKALAHRPWDEYIFKRGENLEKLKTIGKSFRDFGNSEEYYNSLKSDFGLSPEGAASIAYDLSKPSNAYISKIKLSNAENANDNTIKYAAELEDYLTKNDSILSIAKHIREKDSFFDIKTFLSEVRKSQDKLGLTPQQKAEINDPGIADIFPNWGDIFLFPKIGRG